MEKSRIFMEALKLHGKVHTMLKGMGEALLLYMYS